MANAKIAQIIRLEIQSCDTTAFLPDGNKGATLSLRSEPDQTQRAARSRFWNLAFLRY